MPESFPSQSSTTMLCDTLEMVIIKHGFCNCIITTGHLMTFSSKSWRDHKIPILKQVKKKLHSILKTLQLSHSQANISSIWEVLLQLWNTFSKELYLKTSFSLKTKHKYLKAFYFCQKTIRFFVLFSNPCQFFFVSLTFGSFYSILTES